MEQLNLESMESIVAGGDATYRVGRVLGALAAGFWDYLINDYQPVPRGQVY